MNPIKYIPHAIRERTRAAIFGKNHFQDLARLAPALGVRTVFDVGAQKGYEAILFAKNGCKVIAFEKDFDQLAALRRNIRSEGVDPYNVLYGHSRASACVISAWLSVGDAENSDTMPAQTTLSSFMELIDTHPDLVKIGTDGDDLRVLEGFPFEQYKPAVFSVEWDREGRVAAKLKQEGYNLIYAIYKPVNRWRRAMFSRYSMNPDFQGGEWGDVIATRQRLTISPNGRNLRI